MSATAITEAPGEPVVHTCSCGATYTRTEWEALPSPGIQADDEESLDLRNCSRCHSTRAVVVKESK